MFCPLPLEGFHRRIEGPIISRGESQFDWRCVHAGSRWKVSAFTGAGWRRPSCEGDAPARLPSSAEHGCHLGFLNAANDDTHMEVFCRKDRPTCVGPRARIAPSPVGAPLETERVAATMDRQERGANPLPTDSSELCLQTKEELGVPIDRRSPDGAKPTGGVLHMNCFADRFLRQPLKPSPKARPLIPRSHERMKKPRWSTLEPQRLQTPTCTTAPFGRWQLGSVTHWRSPVEPMALAVDE